MELSSRWELGLISRCQQFSFLLGDDSIDCRELPRPLYIVEELTEIKAIIIWRVSFGMVGGSDGAHLVTIYGVVIEESFHLLSDFRN